MEPHAATEVSATGARLVCRLAELVKGKRGASVVGVAFDCNKCLARLQGGKILVAESARLLLANLEMTGASLAKKAKLLQAGLRCTLLCTPFSEGWHKAK